MAIAKGSAALGSVAPHTYKERHEDFNMVDK